jgi:hypothetical protein
MHTQQHFYAVKNAKFTNTLLAIEHRANPDPESITFQWSQLSDTLIHCTQAPVHCHNVALSQHVKVKVVIV